MGDGSARCQHVYVHNVAHAHCLAARSLLAAGAVAGGRAYFVTDAPPANFFDYLEPVVRGAGGRVLPRWVSLPRGLMYVLGAALDGLSWLARPVVRFTPQLSRFAVTYICQDFTFSDARARQELGYAPVYSEAESFARTIRWFREHGPVERSTVAAT
jgi:nucleoside-diphosphate-sugar epimerase